MQVTRLKDHEYLAGDYSTANIAYWSWVHTYKWSGINADGIDNLKRWRDAIRILLSGEKGRAVRKRLDFAA